MVPSIPNFGNTGGLVGAVIGSVQQVTGQLTNIQRTIHEMTTQMQRMVETGSRIVTGPLHYADDAALPQLPYPNIPDAAMKTFNDWAQQLQSINSVLREMNQQWSRVIDSGSRMITGKLLAEGTTASPFGIPGLGSVPGSEAIQSALSLLSNQFSSIQRALTDFSSQLTRMVETGVRGLGGLEADTPSITPPSLNPGEAVLSVVNSLTQQFTQVQRLLQDLNGQLTRMVETGSRVLG